MPQCLEKAIAALESRYSGGREPDKVKALIEKAKTNPETTKAQKVLDSLSKKPTAKMTPEDLAAHKTNVESATKAVEEAKGTDTANLEALKNELTVAEGNDTSYQEAHAKELAEADKELEKAEAEVAKIPDLKNRLKETNTHLVTRIAEHHAAVSVLATLSDPIRDLPATITTTERGLSELKQTALEKYQGLPPELRESRMKASLQAIKDIDQALSVGDLPEENQQALKARREYFKADVAGAKASKTLNNKDKSKNLSGSIMQAIHAKNPDNPHIFGLSEGVKSENFRKSVHNTMAELNDDEFAEAMSSHVPTRTKAMLETWPWPSGRLIGIPSR